MTTINPISMSNVFTDENSAIVSDFGIRSASDKMYVGLLEALKNNIFVAKFDNQKNGGLLGPWKIEQITEPKYIMDKMILYKTTNLESHKVRFLLIFIKTDNLDESEEINKKAVDIFNEVKKSLPLEKEQELMIY